VRGEGRWIEDGDFALWKVWVAWLGEVWVEEWCVRWICGEMRMWWRLRAGI
jgi:hypothetical protein